MSHKKYKKRHSQSTINAKRQANQAKLADEKDRARKRMDPTARTLLFGNLVFLSITVLLERNGLISPLFSGACTIIGVILLILALWFQFGGKGQDRSPLVYLLLFGGNWYMIVGTTSFSV